MSKVLHIQKGVEEAARDLLEYLLTENKVRGVVTLMKRHATQDVGYSLITRGDELKEARPLYPLMPANGGQILSRLTLTEPWKEPLAAVVKPCELRSFIELVKRNQGNLDNILLISLSCPGVYPLDKSSNGDVEEALPGYWDQTRSADIIPDSRPTCQSCLHFTPHNADLIISLVGEQDLDKNCRIFLNSAKGTEFAQGINGSVHEQELETPDIGLLRSKREAERTKRFEQIESEASGITGIINTFGKCIGCHGCSNACPVCYCDLCFFDSHENESSPFVFESELEKKGATRLPTGTIFFHLGRLSHMSVSCTGCGMCADVCPVDIPVSTIFSMVGESVQRAFDYTPGINAEEAVPSAIYKEDEFTEIGEN
ncbi:4Fe-4S binding protein [Acidobacteriota bacterium]